MDLDGIHVSMMALGPTWWMMMSEILSAMMDKIIVNHILFEYKEEP